MPSDSEMSSGEFAALYEGFRPRAPVIIDMNMIISLDVQFDENNELVLEADVEADLDTYRANERIRSNLYVFLNLALRVESVDFVLKASVRMNTELDVNMSLRVQLAVNYDHPSRLNINARVLKLVAACDLYSHANPEMIMWSGSSSDSDFE